MALTIADAVLALASGEVVAFPTDTVYGLAARPEYAARIYELKERPAGLPLILMLPSAEAAKEYVVVDARARALMDRWWPGALTLVLPSSTPGDPSLGVRVPAHRIALELLRAAGPLLTTSANRHGEPDALTAADAAKLPGLGGVLDGGGVPGGTPSTVLDLTHPEPRVLREGAIPAAELL